MAAYKVHKKRTVGLKPVSGLRTNVHSDYTKGAAKDFGTPSGAMSPSMMGRYAPRSEQHMLPGRARSRKRGGNRKLF